MSDTEDVKPDDPWFYRAAVKFGLPAVAFGALLWFLIITVHAQLMSVQEEHRSIMSAQEQAVEAAQERYGNLVVQTHEELKVLRQICLQLAKTDPERETCRGEH